MCILCVVQKWSRRVATMLPWLVIPLIVLWAVSQLLPPGFRFEITSPRLACVMVLLVTLFWYEILMPQLSAWRARRRARLRERRRVEAMEMQKLRKTATRRCRNCLTPYRDQNPGGGKFMCSYCGHISKRPVLDMSGAGPVLGITNSSIIGRKVLNGRLWSDNGWMCRQDWRENGNWIGGNFPTKSSHWFYSSEDGSFDENSYSGSMFFGYKVLGSFFLSFRWVWRKIFRVGSSREDDSLDKENKGSFLRKRENDIDCHESKGEKARRKAEEKRQARLEREMLEEEERKQREEVARLVEEQRKLRDMKSEAERERETKRGTEKKSQERKKEKDKRSSKSNSDGEDIERRAASRESEKKHEFDKKSEIERRDFQKTAMEMGHGNKVFSNSFSRGSNGIRYFDRMKGSFLSSSSRAFNGANFFGKGIHSATAVSKVNNKYTASVDHFQSSANRGKFASNADDHKISQTTFHRPLGSDLQPQATVQKKSWQQLFTRSPSISLPSSDANTILQSSQKHQTDSQGLLIPDDASLTYPLDNNNINFGLSSPFAFSTSTNSSMSSCSASPPTTEPMFPLIGEQLTHNVISEEAELFEDPCYVPDPVSLLGPVSESLDNFPLDPGHGFVKKTGLERSRVLKNVSASTEVNRPSPIESPMSRSRVSEERHITSKEKDITLSLDGSSNEHNQGTWQMWDTPPIVQEGLGFVGGPASWLLPLGRKKSNQEDIVHPLPRKAMISQKICNDNSQNGGTFSPLGPISNDNDPWLQTVLQPLPGNGENNFSPLNYREDISLDEVTYNSSSRSAAGTSFEQSPANCWSKREGNVHGPGGIVESLTLAKPRVGGLFSTSDVKSVWSFN